MLLLALPSVLSLIGGFVFIVLPLSVLLEVLRCIYLEYRGDRVPILLYHRLISKSDADAGRVPDDEMIWVCYDAAFADQMRYLHDAGYTTLDFDDYLATRHGAAPLPAKPVIITFDDGYLSHYTLAYPSLKRHGHKATLFVAPEPDEYTRRIAEGVDGFLNDDQMRELVANNVAVQSHTLTHCILNELDDERARYELTESKRRLAEITGRPIDHIAIPRAGYSRRIKRLVRETGYRTACCNNKGSATGLSDPLALPRIVIERDMDLDQFKACLTPRAAAMLRIVGNLKRIPEHLGGARFAGAVRRLLYFGPLRPLFQTRNLKRVVAVAALLYLICSACFTYYLLVA